ncbi:hypothetical protein RZS08_31525, partial [Arthrospira platensis SPKY1]|nr:hypothetical protein [Arthrospira platensis SPKY1]
MYIANRLTTAREYGADAGCRPHPTFGAHLGPMRLLTPPASLLQAVALLGEVILALGQGLVHGWV